MPHDPTLAAMGTIHTTDMQRDAVHIAVVQMTAAVSLQPGWRIGRDARGLAVKADEDDIEAIGIVDPYLIDAVPTGSRFFMLLFPGTITSLKHLWTHPAFDVVDHRPSTLVRLIPPVVEVPRSTVRTMVEHDRTMAQLVLEDIVRRAGTSFYDLMRAAYCAAGPDGYGPITLGTDNDLYDVPSEFWPAWSMYTGRPIPNDAAQTFSCSC